MCSAGACLGGNTDIFEAFSVCLFSLRNSGMLTGGVHVAVFHCGVTPQTHPAIRDQAYPEDCLPADEGN